MVLHGIAGWIWLVQVETRTIGQLLHASIVASAVCTAPDERRPVTPKHAVPVSPHNSALEESGLRRPVRRSDSSSGCLALWTKVRAPHLGTTLGRQPGMYAELLSSVCTYAAPALSFSLPRHPLASPRRSPTPPTPSPPAHSEPACSGAQTSPWPVTTPWWLPTA